MLLGILAAALPLQGLAAATMPACAIDHQSHFPTVALSHSLAESHSHPADAKGSDVAAHAHPVAAETQDGKTDRADSGAHKCSACTACCLNAAAPTEPVAIGTVELGDGFAALVIATPAPYLTDGPERPPRTFLA